MTYGNADQNPLGVMAGVTAVMNGIIQRVNGDASKSAGGSGMTGGTGRCHGHGLAMIHISRGSMNGQPIAAMAEVAVSSTVGGQADQRPAARRVMTEVAVILMD